MKFVIASHSERLAGAERSLFAIVAAALEAGHEVVVTVPQQGALQSKINVTFPDVQVIEIPTHSWMHGSRFTFKSVPRTLTSILESIVHARLYRQISPDFIVINSSVIPAPMIAAALCRIPSIVMVRESIRTNTQLFSIVPKSILIRLIEGMSTFRFAVSHYVADQLNQPCTVDFPDVRRDLGIESLWPTDNEAKPTRARALRAVMLGSFSPEKGQDDAIQAVALARAAGVQIDLSLYGYAHESEILKLQEWCDRHGLSDRIRHKGFIDDPKEAYGSADVSLVCSKNEAYGRVTAESLLMGVPVVGYELGGTTEILRAGGGISCKPTSTDLANVLVSLAEDPNLLNDLHSQCRSLRADSGEFGNSGRTVSRMVEKIIGVGG
ncbi:glycosyltransferase family 4 protein [Arthrobacter sp. FB24]|uniref:glycosyltransferase family 4 protein n=1 Tax=Arthrobacter sp. (strain FB24) TaxID=290399 RepID=UPI0018DEC0E1|nr:glycosyltransferase family 4 protein [Arthrobacter sp. FB24]